MKEVLVWVLVIVNSSYSYTTSRVEYSPPMHDIDSCLRLKQAVAEIAYRDVRAKCVQIRMVVTK